jgi:hypothetical protein
VLFGRSHTIRVNAGFRTEKLVRRKNLTSPEDSNLIELLDRVLDNGIVVDPWARISLPGTDLLKMNQRMVVEFMETLA